MGMRVQLISIPIWVTEHGSKWQESRSFMPLSLILDAERRTEDGLKLWHERGAEDALNYK